MSTEKGTITMAYLARLGPGSLSSLAEGGTIVGLARATRLAVTITGSYNTAGSVLRAHLMTSPDNINWDTIAFGSLDNALGIPPALKQRTKTIDAQPAYMKTKMENLAVGTPIINAKVIATRQIEY